MKYSIKSLSRTEKLLFIAVFIYGIGVEAAYFVGITGYAAYELHATAALIASIMFALTIGQMVGSAVGGGTVDRIGPRRTIMLASIGTVVTSIGSQFIGKNIAAFVAFAAIVGICFALNRTAYYAFAPYVAQGRDGLKRINSYMMVGTYTAAIVGPAIGAVIVRYFSTMRVFVFCAGAVLISMVFMLYTKEVFQPERTDEKKHPVKEAFEGVRLVFSIASLRFYLIAGILMWFSFGAFDALESLYYKNVVGVGVEWMGWVNTAIGVGLVIGVLLLSRIPSKYITSVLLALMVGFEGLGSVLYVVTHNIWWVMVGGVVLGVAFGIAEPLMRTLIQADSPLESVGRVSGAIQVFRIGLTLIPLALAPALSKVFGVQSVLVGASVLTVILACTFLPLARKVDKHGAASRHIDHIDPFIDGEEGNPHERIPVRADDSKWTDVVS